MKDQFINPYTYVYRVRPERNEAYPWTDLGDSKLFAHCYRGRIRYVPERKCWYVYQDGIWVEDMGGTEGDGAVQGICQCA